MTEHYSLEKIIHDSVYPSFPTMVCQSKLQKNTLHPSGRHSNYRFIGSTIIDQSEEKISSYEFGTKEKRTLIEDFISS